MSWSFRYWLASLNPTRPFIHPPAPEATVPTSRRPVVPETPLPTPEEVAANCTCRQHRPTRVYDGAAAASIWAWSDQGQGYVIEGLPALDWRGRPAGISLDTLKALHPAASAVTA